MFADGRRRGRLGTAEWRSAGTVHAGELLMHIYMHARFHDAAYMACTHAAETRLSYARSYAACSCAARGICTVVQSTNGQPVEQGAVRRPGGGAPLTR